MVDYSCCWDCIGKNGNPCVEDVALCLCNNKDPYTLYPSCFSVDAGCKLEKAAMNKNYLPVIVSSCTDVHISKVHVISNHCHPPKGGSGHPRKRPYEEEDVLDCKKVLQNQARAKKRAILDGDASPPVIHSFCVMACSTCGRTLHNRHQCRMPHAGFSNAMLVAKMDKAISKGHLIVEINYMMEKINYHAQ
eukprot:1344191-Ditylum_brightwellii.AAC.1